MADFFKISLKSFAWVHVAAGIGGTLAALFVKNSVAIGFAVGYIIGVVNALWLFRAAVKSVKLDTVKASRHVAVHYYLRFYAMAAVFSALIYFRLLSPWAPVIGLSAAMLATAGVLIYSSLTALRSPDIT